MTIDINAVRKDFPILDQEVNGNPLVYFDNAATTQKPQAVIDCLVNYYQHDNANVHRGVHALSERATQQYEATRAKVQRFINAKECREIVFTKSATEAINLVAQSFVVPRIRAGEEILLTTMEHHSNIVPWQLVSKATASNLRVVPIDDNGELIQAEFKKLLTPETKLLAITHVSNALGTVNPIKDMIKIAHEHDVTVLVDGAQAAPHHIIDVQDLDADFYAFSGHKMYGPTGVGVLYAKAELLTSMPPYQGGGEMIIKVSFDQTEYNVIPHKFEAGTPNIAGVIGLGAAIDYLNQLGLEAIAAYETELFNYLMDAVNQEKGLTVIGTAAAKVPVLSFNLDGIHPHDVGTILNSLGIAVRSGHHCAMPVMDHFSVAATSRVSLSFYNTKQEIDAFIAALARVREVFSP